ncbi:latent-transforming growth factor beta-binding protein 4-like, partial [Pezoporus wallicus]|uniref:latent-transforming growth factor beta-binding protein 4-like n=1 Tax=Pezoporus wallicus TaxID=35540 RepID=UPI00254B3E96
LPQSDAPCPPGFQRQNGSCEDVDECGRGGFCRNGLCTNTPGSFACLCPPGFLLDASWSSCISQQVLSEARGPCFRVLRAGRCALPTLRNITRQICCCSRVGKAWGGSCLRCPPPGSEGFKEICPAGPGYHYSASDLRFNARYLGQDWTHVPLGQPRASTAAPPATREHPQTPPRSIPPPPEPPKSPSPHPQQPQPHGPGSGPPPIVTPLPAATTRPPRPPHEPPPAPEVIVVPRPTMGLLGPIPTPEAPAGSVCDRNPQLCGPGRCVPHRGGYSCRCHPGFWLSTQGTHCIDVDECRRSPRPCTHGRCENTVGSYRCLCQAGYRPSAAGTECQDVDECDQSPPPCTHGRCENLPGSYRCLCPGGYRAVAPGEPCQDIDECENEAACPGQECLNTAGSFQCRPCLVGFRPHRGRCADINECLEGDFCFPHGECLNTEGSFTCLCAQGFTPTAAGTACTDIDECQRGGLCAGGLCTNTAGSFECRCPPGFRSDPEQAECHELPRTSPHHRCRPPPQTGSPPFPPLPPHYPPDVDECSHNGTLCGAHATCLNLPGSFQCACDPGYETAPNGHHCVDVNECETLLGVCGAERCENADGSFLCLCPDGRHEFDPVRGRCGAPSGAAPALLRSAPGGSAGVTAAHARCWRPASPGGSAAAAWAGRGGSDAPPPTTTPTPPPTTDPAPNPAP